MNNTTSVSGEASKPSNGRLPAVVALGISVALAVANIYLLSKTNDLEQQVNQMRGAVKSEIASVEHDFAARSTEHNQAVAELRQAIEDTGTQSAQAASKATVVAKRYSEALEKKLAQQAQAQQEGQQALSAQLGEMRDAATNTDQRVSGIATDVTKVGSEVAQTKTDLDKTISDLHSMRGDLGIQSGLIATNAKELAALRARGERDYVEFQLTKTKAPQRIGDVAVQLKKSDNKRNRYTIELVANDKRVEKKDRTINEPVQFYMAKARTPYEIVVNEVRSDRIVGYLAAPKVRDLR